MDLEAGGRLEGGIDAVQIADGILSSYYSLWAALTDKETFAVDESWRITERVQRLNALGFDIGEMSIQTTPDGTRVSIQPKVVDAGHHQRRLRSEEHTSELQSLMRISYAVFCLKNKKNRYQQTRHKQRQQK